MINFESKTFKIGLWTVLLLPAEVSKKLPSRGPVMVMGTINGFPFKTPLEPDGRGSHWFRIDGIKGAPKAGETANISIEVSDDWPEPKVPTELKSALNANKKASKTWGEITIHARWDWVRWVNSTKVAATRDNHIKVAISKLESGMRRPCCFNQTLCLVHEVSKRGALILPDEKK